MPDRSSYDRGPEKRRHRSLTLRLSSPADLRNLLSMSYSDCAYQSTSDETEEYSSMIDVHVITTTRKKTDQSCRQTMYVQSTVQCFSLFLDILQLVTECV